MIKIQEQIKRQKKEVLLFVSFPLCGLASNNGFIVVFVYDSRCKKQWHIWCIHNLWDREF